MSNNQNDILGLVNTDAAAAAPPRSSARESAALDSLLALHNSTAVVPGVIGTQLNTVRPEPTPAPVKTFVTTGSARTVINAGTKKVFLTGRLRSGKDFCALAVGAEIMGFATPLYALRSYFFGDGLSKDAHGAREFLQSAGNVGRGEVSVRYPLSLARAVFTSTCRTLGAQGEFGSEHEVTWLDFGRDPDIWLAAFLRRVDKFTEESPDKLVACVNTRFKNEFERLTKEGWVHFHVTCSPQTWEARIKAAGLDPKSPTLTEVSEAMAINLDAQAVSLARRNPTRRLNVIWNDERVAAPSPAFHTLDSFKQLFV